MNRTVLIDGIHRNATEFLNTFYQETGKSGFDERLAQIEDELDRDGTYAHTYEELVYGAKTAWRNSNRCIGRLFYDSLEVIDARHASTAEHVIQALHSHLSYATNKGEIRSVLTLFRPKHPITGDEIRIWNGKLIRYAGYESETGIIGDPEETEFTRMCESLGWTGAGGHFDLLPVVISMPGHKPTWFAAEELSPVEVPIRHPDYPWFKDLGLRWYAVPVITDMVLEIGGLQYTAAPFNGWFMETEIGSRNLGDAQRYNQLPIIAKQMGLQTLSDKSFWKDRALIELNIAVYHSFREDGIRMVDHHTASRQFLVFCQKEADAGREVMADWAWIVPPQSASSMEVFHRGWKNEVISPNFYYNTPAWKKTSETAVASGCPFHILTRNPT